MLFFKDVNYRRLVLALADLKLVGSKPFQKPFWVSPLIDVFEMLITVKRNRSSVKYCDRGGVLSYFDISMDIVNMLICWDCLRFGSSDACEKHCIAFCTVSYMVAER